MNIILIISIGILIVTTIILLILCLTRKENLSTKGSPFVRRQYENRLCYDYDPRWKDDMSTFPGYEMIRNMSEEACKQKSLDEKLSTYSVQAINGTPYCFLPKTKDGKQAQCTLVEVDGIEPGKPASIAKTYAWDYNTKAWVGSSCLGGNPPSTVCPICAPGSISCCAAPSKAPNRACSSSDLAGTAGVCAAVGGCNKPVPVPLCMPGLKCPYTKLDSTGY